MASLSTRHAACSAVKLVVTLVAYQLLAAAIFSRVLIDRTDTFLGWGDASTQSYAWFMKVWRAFQHGEFALWDFGIFSGTSFIGEMQPAPFYPLSIAFA